MAQTMTNEQNHATFIGQHPDTDELICGIITPEFDVEHAPFSFEVIKGDIVISGGGKIITFTVPEHLHHALRQGANLYLANIGGSEQSHLVHRSKAALH